MKQLIAALAGIAICISTSSCRKEKADVSNIFVVTGTATAEPSARNPQAYATIYGGYNADTKKLAFNINWYDVGGHPIGASIKFSNNKLVKKYGVTEGNANGLVAGDAELTEEQAQTLLDGRLHYTVNTVENPEGEIKGELKVTREQ